MVKNASGNNLSCTVDIQPRNTTQSNSLKSFEQNRVTFKSNTPGWFPSSGKNDNLVISFSDDDSGSDTEDYRHKTAFENKSNTTRVDGSGRPPTSSAVKVKNLQQTARNVSKAIPKKLSPSRTLTTTRNHGGANSWVSRPPSVDQRSRVRNFSIKTKLGSLECGDQVGLRNSKLQDLRQQIALRESELKLKAAQQNKDLVIDSCENYHLGRLDQKEPDKKRLKVSGSYSHRLTTDGRQDIPATKSTVPVKEPTPERSSLQDGNKVDRSQKDIPRSRIESEIVKWDKQNGKQVHVPPENVLSVVKDVANPNASCNQSDRDSRRVNTGPVLHNTSQLANMTSSNFLKNAERIESDPASTAAGCHPSSFLSNATREQNVMENSEYTKAISGDKIDGPSFNNVHQVNTASLGNFSGNGNVSGNSNVDIQSLLDMEELLDKELEEAQEHRRICEIEERKALKAYRKAQRALIEANASCTKLYRQRELCSARFRSFVMDDSNLLWSSGQHETLGNEFDLSKHVSGNMHLAPTSTHQMQSGYVGYNQGGYDSSMQCINGDLQNFSHEHENGQNLGSEPCSEQDASTSELLPRKSKNALNGISPQSNELMVSADEEEEACQLDLESVQPNFEYQQKDQIAEGRQISTDYRHNNKLSAVSSQDPLLLEATLRSELFARLGMRTFSKDSGSCFNVEPSVEQRADNDIGSDKMQMSNGSVPSSGEQSQQHDIGGTDKPERRIQEAPFQIQDKCLVEKGLLEFHSTYHSKGNKFPTTMNHSTSVLLSPPILRGAFGHLKSELCIALSNQSGNQHNHGRNFEIEEVACVNSDKTQACYLIANSKPDIVKGYVGKEMGSYTCNLAIDPLWPLCMYELRGKCNNDECPWQHVKYFADRNKNLHDDSDSAGCQIGSTIPQEHCNVGTKLSKGHDILTPPTYIVGLDILKADSYQYQSVIARRHGLCWQKCLSVSLAISSIYPKDLPADLSLIGDGRIECIGSWNRQSSFFRSRNGVLNKLKQVELSNEQCVEMALLILNQDANKLEGMKKALSLLSRALEADPTSEILWITYLLIFYSNTNSVGKDDMFSYSVKHNEGSYALWLMYINSRTPLNHRLDAYDAALSVLCRCASASDGDEMHASACILDLFLQMLQCFCMSGNTEKAIQRISRLLIPATGSNDRHSLFLSDILTCLTISDKLIFWVCCVYLVIYRKLPDAVLQLLECEKELFAIDWPPVQLEDDEKQRAIKLIEMAVNSVELYSNGESLEKETNLRSAHCFAVNHIWCMAVLNGLECSMNLLEKYIKLYPSCLELVLMKARLQKHDFGDLSSVGFEEALIKWPKGVPGIQCIWNQYVEYALQNGRHDFAAELMDRWFHSVWKVQYSQVEISDPLVADMSHSSPESTSTSDPEFSVSNRNQMDVMFGYLNLSLHRLLQNDWNEARLAIDAALKAAASEHFKHCVREHAMLLLINESEPKEGAPISWQLKLLNSYLDRARSLPYLKLLPRQFINNIERPRLQQLIDNLLSPVSSDFSLVNLVLEVCYGPSLLPRNFSKLKDLVDFVEGIMEIVPSNYQLAFSVFKLLNKDHNPNITDAVPESVLFWASSSLVSAIFHAVPVAPEYVWVEAAGILGNISSIEEISERFFKRALSVYPFSIKLWKCYYDLSKTKGDLNTIVKAAREKGIELD
ncbi:hypothetical protein CISIN_1g000307mg [Citrus sinensis]|uniref:Putative zinc-finger domain-containing protein n=1 Tax=Citrus sinensis TaxID=2711 RepID=A0A067FNM0_CITSI|nr:hypothetical protein CISIN_1g000307mg [Citrus sinensis]